MKVAMPSRLAIGAMVFIAWVALAARTEAHDQAGRTPGAAAPSPNPQPRPLPPPQRPDGRAPEVRVPSVDDDGPPVGRGCPDQGQKLELIV